jgi:sortase A
MRTLLRLFARLLVMLGCLVTLAAGVALLRPAWLQDVYTTAMPIVTELYELRSGSDPVPEPGAEPDPRPVPKPAPRFEAGEPIGTIEIPRLRLSSVVIESDEAAALLLGVGHLSDTPMPWSGGNSVLAAHRDTFFRPLAGIRRNDVIRFTTNDAEFEYIVRDTRIVDPTDVDVLAPTAVSTLTLITCYPFNYIGPAPQRFVVRAERASL